MRKQLIFGNSDRKIPPAFQPWDLLIGGREHDVLGPQGKFEEVKKQTCESGVTWFAPDCKTMSSARDKPIRGRKKQRR